MFKTVFLAALLPCAAHAQDAAIWGGTGCRMALVDGQAHVAEVHCMNVLTAYAPWTEGMMIAGGLDVHLSVLHGPGDVPDEFTITPPDGFVAVPSFLVMDEDTTGVVLIYEWAGM